MTSAFPLVVLCYHRVAPHPSDGVGRHPYFLRGTAVRPATFRQHVRDLSELLPVASEARALDIIKAKERPRKTSCWLTFDDGYRDVLLQAAPILEAHGVHASIFISTSTLAGRSLPVDDWYDAVLNARRRRGALEDERGGTWDFDLDQDADFLRFIKGPEKKRYVSSTQSAQADLLARLRHALDSRPPLARDRYLSNADLQELQARGWTVGSHAHNHRHLSSLGERERLAELVESAKLLEETCGQRPRSLAYPDGRYCSLTEAQVLEAGYESGLALGQRPVRPGDPVTAIPRWIPPDDPAWVRETLIPTLEKSGVHG